MHISESFIGGASCNYWPFTYSPPFCSRVPKISFQSWVPLQSAVITVVSKNSFTLGSHLLLNTNKELVQLSCPLHR